MSEEKPTRKRTQSEIEEEENRLKHRIEITERGTKKAGWQDSPSHDHDADFFDKDKTNIYGRLKYNLSKSDEDKKKRRKRKRKNPKNQRKAIRKSVTNQSHQVLIQNHL